MYAPFSQSQAGICTDVAVCVEEEEDLRGFCIRSSRMSFEFSRCLNGRLPLDYLRDVKASAFTGVFFVIV